MTTSESELETLERENEELREKISQAQSVRAQAQAQAESDHRVALLKEEQARLTEQLNSEVAQVEAAFTVADELAEKAAAPVETAYQRMMRESEEANAVAQAAADERARYNALSPEQKKAEDAANDKAAKAEADAQAKAAVEADAQAKAAKEAADAEAAKAKAPPAPPVTDTNGNGGK